MKFSLGCSSISDSSVQPARSGPRVGQRPGSSLVLALVACLLFAAAGCRSAVESPEEEPGPEALPPVDYARNDIAPSWLSQPLSWEKLRSIETWLATEGSRSAWRIEGELALNQGRLAFARREIGQREKEAVAPFQSRIRTARAGFMRVLGESDASAQQRQRAQDGVALADKLLAQVASRTSSGIGVPVIARAAWGAMPAHPERMDRTKGPYTRVTVHHSADADPVHLDGSLGTSAAAARNIQSAHVRGKDYGDIGYHFLVDPWGRVLEGRDLVYQGAHASGDNNIQNIGVCMIGNFNEVRPTKAALESLRRVLDHLRRTYSISRVRVFNHRDLRNTECPGDNLAPWVEQYRR